MAAFLLHMVVAPVSAGLYAAPVLPASRTTGQTMSPIEIF